MELVFIGDIVEKNGKTVKENNLKKVHNIPVGSLVEIDYENDEEYKGVRLYVVCLTRDCDGTPLYNLCHNKTKTKVDKEGFRNYDWVGGFAEHSLKVIK